MTEAVFDFAAINRRMNRKPEPVAAMTPNATTVAALGAAEQGEGTVLPSWWTWEAYRSEVDALRASLDETETVFIGWDISQPD